MTSLAVATTRDVLQYASRLSGRPKRVRSWYTITSLDQDGLLGIGLDMLDSGVAAGAWALTDKVVYSPIMVREDFTITQMFVMNGTTVSGTYDQGVFDEAGNLLVSTGNQTATGANTLQVTNVTDTNLSPGRYFLAYGADNTTVTPVRANPNALIGVFLGVKEMAAGIAGSPRVLVNPATLVNTTVGIVPLTGITGAKFA